MTYGTGASAQYALAHGSIEYYFSTHTVWGTVETIEFGTIGSGTYDENGYLVGADVELTITGLTFYNAQSPEAEVEATGAVHNLAVALMAGSSVTDDDLALLNQQLDEYAQTFIGSAYDDTYTGTIFADTVEGNAGDDTLDGGAGTDTAVYGGSLADYTWVDNGDGSWTITDNRTGEDNDGADTLANIEYLEFTDQTVTIDGGEVEDLAPTGLALSASNVAENSATGTVVGELSATDPEGEALTYTLTDDADGRFSLSTSGGVTRLVVAGALDYETAASYTVTVTVSDGVNDVTKDFTIAVGDVDETPANSAPSKPTLSADAVSEAASVGTVVGTLAATDPDGDALSYALTDSADGTFAIVTEGGVTKLVVASTLDYETATSHQVTVEVSDGAGGEFDLDLHDHGDRRDRGQEEGRHGQGVRGRRHHSRRGRQGQGQVGRRRRLAGRRQGERHARRRSGERPAGRRGRRRQAQGRQRRRHFRLRFRFRQYGEGQGPRPDPRLQPQAGGHDRRLRHRCAQRHGGLLVYREVEVRRGGGRASRRQAGQEHAGQRRYRRRRQGGLRDRIGPGHQPEGNRLRALIGGTSGPRMAGSVNRATRPRSRRGSRACPPRGPGRCRR